MAARTYLDIYQQWLTIQGRDVKAEAKRLVNGILLNMASGDLYRSIKYQVFAEGGYANAAAFVDIGSSDSKAYIWEIEGIRGPINAPPGEAIKIVKRGQQKIGSRFPVVIRHATYTRVKYKPPVAFLKTALYNVMVYGDAEERLHQLGNGVARVIVARYKEVLGRDPNISFK